MTLEGLASMMGINNYTLITNRAQLLTWIFFLPGFLWGFPVAPFEWKYILSEGGFMLLISLTPWSGREDCDLSLSAKLAQQHIYEHKKLAYWIMRASSKELFADWAPPPAACVTTWERSGYICTYETKIRWSADKFDVQQCFRHSVAAGCP